MGQLIPVHVTAQMVAVLTFKKLTVHTEEKSQELAAYRKSINIVLLKKTQIHASYGSFCDQFPVAAYIVSILLHNPSATADVQKKFLATDWEILNHCRIIKSLAFRFRVRVFTGDFVLLF